MKELPTLGFIDALNTATSKIFKFNGRARRSEFWWTQLIVYLVSLVLTPIVGGILSLLTIPLTFRRLHDTGRSGWWWGVGALLKVAFYICLIIDIIGASFVDFEYATTSQIWSLVTKYGIMLIVIAAYSVVMLVFYCLDSDPEENKYGPSPKYLDDEPTSESAKGLQRTATEPTNTQAP